MDAEEMKSFQQIQDENTSKISLLNFIKKYSESFNLSSLTSSGQWIKLWISSFEHLKATATIQMECLQTIRILSRDKTYLNETINDSQFDSLLDIGE